MNPVIHWAGGGNPGIVLAAGPVMTMSAPSWTSPTATALPMPLSAPVTTAAFPARRPIQEVPGQPDPQCIDRLASVYLMKCAV
jgi:hypothetical protein